MNDENFMQIIADAERPVVIMFMSSFCGPSHAVFPLVDKLIADKRYQFDYHEVNVEDCPLITREYAVKGTPELLFLDNGKPLGSRLGTMVMEDLTSFMDDMFERVGEAA